MFLPIWDCTNVVKKLDQIHSFQQPNRQSIWRYNVNTNTTSFSSKCFGWLIIQLHSSRLTWKIDSASDNITHLIVYCPWSIISLNVFLWMTALDWMTLNNTRSKHFTKLFRVDATLFSWLALVSVKTDEIATLWYHVKQSLHTSCLISCQ